MDKTIRFISDPNELKAEDYRYWKSVRPGERMQKTWGADSYGIPDERTSA